MTDSAGGATASAEPEGGAVFSRLPLLRSEREYTTVGVLATGFASAVATWCFLIGGYSSNLVGALQGSVTLIAGCVIGVALSAIGSALACNRYGLEQIDFTKSAFGQRGSRFIMVFYVINAIGWTGLILVMSGSGMRSIALLTGVPRGPLLIRAITMGGIVLSFIIAVRGIGMLDRFNKVLTPCLILACGGIFVLLLVRHGWHAIARAQPVAPLGEPRASYMAAFEYGLGAGFSWWPGIGFLTRNASTQRASFYPQVVTLGLAMGLVCCAPLYAGLIYRTPDPASWMVPLAGGAGGCVLLGLLALANISASAVMMYCAGLALRHVGVLSRMRWRNLQLVAFALVLPFAIAPDFLYEKGSAFLAYNATMYAPISAIVLVDYLILRRSGLNLSQFYENDPQGDYAYWSGFNWVALAIMLGAQGLYIWLLNPNSNTYHGPFTAVGASLPVVVGAGLLHYLSVKLVLAPLGLGGYGRPTAPRPLRQPNL